MQNEIQPSVLGPVVSEMMLSPADSETVNAASALDSSYSTYMEHQIYDDEPGQEGDLAATPAEPVPLAPAAASELPPSTVVNNEEQQRDELAEDEAIQRAYEEEIRLELNNFSERTALGLPRIMSVERNIPSVSL